MEEKVCKMCKRAPSKGKEYGKEKLNISSNYDRSASILAILYFNHKSSGLNWLCFFRSCRRAPILVTYLLAVSILNW
jgi:hypothetical protein